MFKKLITKLDKSMHENKIYCNSCEKWVEPVITLPLTKRICPDCLTITDRIFSKNVSRRVSLDIEIGYDFVAGSTTEIYLIDGSIMNMQCSFFTENIDGIGLVKWYALSANREYNLSLARGNYDIEIQAYAEIKINDMVKKVEQKFIIEEEGNFVRKTLNDQINALGREEETIVSKEVKDQYDKVINKLIPTSDELVKIFVMDGRCHPRWFGEKEKKLFVTLDKEENGRWNFKPVNLPDKFIDDNNTVWKKKYANFHKAVYETKKAATGYGYMMDYYMITYEPWLVPSDAQITEKENIKQELYFVGLFPSNTTEVTYISSDINENRNFQNQVTISTTRKDTPKLNKWSGGMFIQEDEK